MGWASGVYTRVFGSAGWQDDKAALIKILASRHDTHDQDIAAGLNTLRTELRGEALTNATKVLTSVAGTNTITASLTSATPAGTLTGYTAGLMVVIIPANNNTGATTLNINSLGALDVMNGNGGACTGGELIAGVPSILTLDAGADDWIISNPLNSSIAATWTQTQTFTKSGGSGTEAIQLSSAVPVLSWNETDAAANNRYWFQGANAEQFLFGIENDAHSVGTTWLTVDRTGTTVDNVTFPTGTNGALIVGTSFGSVNGIAKLGGSATVPALAAQTTASAVTTVQIWNSATSGDNSLIVFYTDSASVRGSIDFNRAGTAIRYNTTSDGRLKKNVQSARSALGIVMALPVDEFDWIEGDVHVSHGFVAQKLYKIVPDAVSGGDKEGGVMGIDRGALIPVITKALQETIEIAQSQAAAIAQLSARVAALEGPRATTR